MRKETVLGIDLGGTNVRAGLVKNEELGNIRSQKINSNGTSEEMLQQLFLFIDKLMEPSVKAIGIGVPGLVVEGIVYDVVNIPAWKEIALQQLMQEHYQLPVIINNDANCFTLGEFYFGKGKGYDSIVGLTIGTGLGSGVIINKKLYTGANGGAGEFGMIDYLDQCYEYYASGQFFKNVHGIDGETVFKKAEEGNDAALKMCEKFGSHLGNAIKTVLYSTDVPLIILGGSVRHAYKYFAYAMMKQLKTFGFKRAIEHLKIEVSELENSGILGAASLYYDLSA